MAILCLACGIAAVESRAPRQANPAESDVVRMFLARRDDPVTSYRARRRLEARNVRLNQDAWMDVLTSLEDGRLRYEVLAEGGSRLIRTRVLRAAIEGEARLYREPATKTAFAPENYYFAFDGLDGGWAKIRIKPRRKDTLLVDGWLFVSPNDADLGSIGGRLSKNPSFWTSSVQVTRRYERMAGVRVPVSVESTASVKLAGTSTFSMRYSYELVNGVDVRR